jgi:hypothetical protein
MRLQRVLVLLLLAAAFTMSGCVHHRAHRRARLADCCEPVCPCPSYR